MKITLVIGLPASGKTTYAKTLGGFLVDDPKSLSDLPEYADHLVITDPNLCIDSVINASILKLYEKYSKYNVNITRIYFENDPIQCYKNSLNRDGKLVTKYIKLLSQTYKPDEKCLIIPCYGK